MRSLASRLGLVLGSFLLVCLVVAGIEALLRTLEPSYLEEISRNDLSHLHRHSEVYGWEPKPGFSYELRGQHVSINDAGYRGREIPRERRPGVRRIVVLGDSIAFGYGVRDDQTFPYLIGESSPHLEVVNLAVQGYGTDQALIKLEREALAFDPDVVILAFCVANDFSDNAHTRFPYDERFRKPAFALRGNRLEKRDVHLALGLLDRAVFRLAQESILYNRLLHLFGVGDAGARREPRLLRPVKPGEIPLTLRLIHEMDRMARSNGVEFLALIFPDKRNYQPVSPLLPQILESPTLAEVDVLSVYDEYVRRGFPREHYGSIAMDPVFHLNPRGHAVTAEIVREALDRRFPRPPAE